jgi:hypothetical protein
VKAGSNSWYNNRTWLLGVCYTCRTPTNCRRTSTHGNTFVSREIQSKPTCWSFVCLFDGSFSFKHQVLASSSPLSPPPLILFEACLSNLWTIWECLVLCEPILVFGPSPASTSQAIWWFRDLLRPVFCKYYADM